MHIPWQLLVYFLQDVSEAEDGAIEPTQTWPLPRTRGPLWFMDGGTSLVGTGDHCKAKACAAMETEGQYQAEDSFTKSDRSIPVPKAGMRRVRPSVSINRTNKYVNIS